MNFFIYSIIIIIIIIIINSCKLFLKALGEDLSQDSERE